MQKVVINSCYGGFSLSAEAVLLFAKLEGKKIFGYIENPEHGDLKFGERGHVRYNPESKEEPFIIYWLWTDLGDNPEDINKGEWFHDRDVARNNVNLVKVVKKLKGDAGGRCAQLRIVEIPDNIKFEIEEYDGLEHVAEAHRIWN